MVTRESAVETATHLLAKAESPLYFSATMQGCRMVLRITLSGEHAFLPEWWGQPGTLHKVAHAH